MQYAEHATRRRGTLLAAGAIALVCGVGLDAGAQSADQNAQRAAKARQALASAKANPSDTRTYVAERNIVKDKTTGQYRRPTAEETAALVAQLKIMLNPATDDLQAASVAGGGMRIGANGRFSDVVLARPTPGGTMETRCVSSLEEAVAFLGLRLESGSAPTGSDVAEQ